MRRVPVFRFDTRYRQMEEAAGITETRVRCRTCGEEQSVRGAYCLAHGWPECHGETMELVRPEAPHA
jgi:hypothetical protein